MLDRYSMVRYDARHEQAPPHKARPNPLDALRRVVDAGDHAGYGGIAQHGDEAAD